MARDSKLYVFAPDLHFPHYSKKTWAALLGFIHQIRPDGFVFGGDQFDNSEISHHNANKNIFKPAGAFKTNERRFEKLILSPLEKTLGKADKWWLVGNHDAWESQLDEAQPELQGCFDRVSNLHLKERGWKVIPNGKSLKLGKLCVIHGDQLSSGFGAGMYPTKKALEIYNQSVLFGHTHNAQSFSKVSPVETSQKRMGWSSPVLCEMNPAYMRNKPCSWVNGFTAVEVLPNRNFNVYPIVVIQGRFSFAGRVYSGVKGN